MPFIVYTRCRLKIPRFQTVWTQCTRTFDTANGRRRLWIVKFHCSTHSFYADDLIFLPPSTIVNGDNNMMCIHKTIYTYIRVSCVFSRFLNFVFIGHKKSGKIENEKTYTDEDAYYTILLPCKRKSIKSSRNLRKTIKIMRI